MKRVLLTGGRAPATLELARLLHMAGHTVFMAESVPWHLCRGSRAIRKNFRVPPPNQNSAHYADALLNIVRHKQIDLVIPTCEETFYVAMAREHLQPYCTVFTPTISQLRTLHNKWTFIRQAQQYGLPVPATTLITQPEAVQELLHTDNSVVLKPAYSRFATKTIICPQYSSNIPVENIHPQNPWVAQAFVSGRQLCTYSIAHNGKITAHSCYATNFTAGQGVAITFKYEEHPTSLAWVMHFVEQENYTGQIAFDFIETNETGEGQVQAIECNPRLTSGIHLFDNQPQLASAFFDSSMDKLVPLPRQPAMLGAAMLLYGLRSTQSKKWWWQTFTSSRDVIFNRSDPLPGLVMQGMVAAHFIYWGLKYGVSPTQASTLDIEWNGM